MTKGPITKNIDPNKIAQLLTLSAQQLDISTLSALRNIRQSVLKRQATSASVFALNTGYATHNPKPNLIQRGAVAGLLVALIIVGMSFWHNAQEPQTDELDVAILTDDLPIEVFVD